MNDDNAPTPGLDTPEQAEGVGAPRDPDLDRLIALVERIGDRTES